MSTDVPIDVAARDLAGWLDQLPCGETVRLVRSDGTPVAIVWPLKPTSGKKLSFEEWERKWLELGEGVSKAWKSDKTALETLAEMRR